MVFMYSCMYSNYMILLHKMQVSKQCIICKPWPVIWVFSALKPPTGTGADNGVFICFAASLDSPCRSLK